MSIINQTVEALNNRFSCRLTPNDYLEWKARGFAFNKFDKYAKLVLKDSYSVFSSIDRLEPALHYALGIGSDIANGIKIASICRMFNIREATGFNEGAQLPIVQSEGRYFIKDIDGKLKDEVDFDNNIDEVEDVLGRPIKIGDKVDILSDYTGDFSEIDADLATKADAFEYKNVYQGIIQGFILRQDPEINNLLEQTRVNPKTNQKSLISTYDSLEKEVEEEFDFDPSESKEKDKYVKDKLKDKIDENTEDYGEVVPWAILQMLDSNGQPTSEMKAVVYYNLSKRVSISGREAAVELRKAYAAMLGIKEAALVNFYGNIVLKYAHEVSSDIKTRLADLYKEHPDLGSEKDEEQDISKIDSLTQNLMDLHNSENYDENQETALLSQIDSITSQMLEKHSQEETGYFSQPSQQAQSTGLKPADAQHDTTQDVSLQEGSRTSSVKKATEYGDASNPAQPGVGTPAPQEGQSAVVEENIPVENA